MIKSILNKTPYELILNNRPKLNYFRPFGCKYFVLNNRKNNLGKFDFKSGGVIFVGYSSTSKAYKVFNKRTLCVEENVHVIFNESRNLKNPAGREESDMEELTPTQRDGTVEVEVQEQNNTIIDKEGGEESGPRLMNPNINEGHQEEPNQNTQGPGPSRPQ